MKRIFIIFQLLLFTMVALSQSPQGFTYQAIIRDNAGNSLPNTPANFKISIVTDAQGTNTVYQEEFSTTSNQIGLVNFTIGDGNPIVGNFNNIKWNESYYIKVEADINNTGNYDLMGINKLQSVPYAMFANGATHSTYADTALYIKNIGSNKVTKIPFGPTTGISTNSSSGYILTDISKNLLDFNKSDYPGISAIYFCVIAKTSNPANNFNVSLINTDTQQEVPNSTISGSNTSYQILKSENLISFFPETPANYSIKIKSDNGQDYVSVEKTYLIIEKGKMVNGMISVEASK